jgi:hypothetical protein
LESVTILRELWRLKVAVIIVGVLSLLVGYAIAYEFKVPPTPRSYTVGVASARILVDTPNSQVVEVAPKGSETLGARANVLANLMIDGTIKDEIAKRAGLRPDELVTGSLATGGAAEDHKLTADSYALTTGVVLNSDQAELPIIRVETQAPDTQKAIGLADAAVKGLDGYLTVRADDERIESTRRLQVSGLGPAQGHDAARGTGRIMALAAAIIVFLAGCAAILIVSGIARGWRTAAALDEMSESEFDLTDLFDGELDPPEELDPPDESDAPPARKRKAASRG